MHALVMHSCTRCTTYTYLCTHIWIRTYLDAEATCFTFYLLDTLQGTNIGKIIDSKVPGTVGHMRHMLVSRRVPPLWSPSPFFHGSTEVFGWGVWGSGWRNILWALILEDLRWPRSAQTRPPLDGLVHVGGSILLPSSCATYPWVSTVYTLHLADIEHFGKFPLEKAHLLKSFSVTSGHFFYSDEQEKVRVEKSWNHF